MTTISLPLPGQSAKRLKEWSLATLRLRWASWMPLVAVVCLAFFLNAWSLSEAGLGNAYYAAAVRSMAMSWENFFFGAFDPGGFITVDKPPVFLWVDAIAVRIFGYSGLALLLPSAVAGAGSVALVWLIVRRYFGVAAATIAGLVLALTPIWVAVHRLNLPEPFYVLALIAAAGAVLRSLESERWWAWTAIAGVLVGVAFNTKMLAAWIPGPALALAIVVGINAPWRTIWRQLLARWLVLAVATFAVSASWMLVVEAWPASDRPYIGGSNDNTVSDLILGYNGLKRIQGAEYAVNGNDTAAAGPDVTSSSSNGGSRQLGTRQESAASPGAGFAQRTLNETDAGVATDLGDDYYGPGGVIAGSPGVLRMFDAANGGQIAWFLPLAVLGGFIALWRWRLDPGRRAVLVLLLGWVFLFAAIFSQTRGIYHSLYTSAMAPGIAALAGIAVVALADLARQRRGWAVAAAGVAIVSLWVQLTVSSRFSGFYEWAEPAGALIVVAGLVLLATSVWRRGAAPMVGLGTIVAGLLLMPAAWSSHEASHASLNTTLPQAGPREGAAGRTFGSKSFDEPEAKLGDWLQTRKDANARWDLVVASAQTAATLIAEDRLSVMSLGGFSGNDPTITAAGLGRLVANGEARYVYDIGLRPEPSAGVSARAVLSAVRLACPLVIDETLPAGYWGSLRDCAGRADALRAHE